MSRNDSEDMPSRKRRRVMALPDGFEKPKQVAAPKISAPKFSSGFDDGGPQPAQKPVSKSKPEVMPQFSGKPVSRSKPVSLQKPTSKTNLKHIPVPNFPLPGPTKEKDPPVFRVLPAPDLRPATKDDALPSARLNLRPPPPPPPLPVVTSSKPIVPLKYFQAPSIPAPVEKASDKRMRTISTTEIALATDLFTESGTAELAHIILHDQHPEIAGQNKDESLEWNIGMSPQKGAKYIKGKGKEAKFVKGGLASRASELISRSQTSLALWHKETEDALSSTSRRLTPDLRLRIIRILDSPAGAKPSSPRKPSVSSSNAMSPGLALCRILSTPSLKHPHLTYLLPKTLEKQYHLVVLSFPTVAPVRSRVQNRIHPRNPEDFVVGREIYAWEPWQEVSLPSQVLPPSNESSATSDPDELTAAPFPLLPSTLPPRPSSSQTGEEEEVPTADTALLCSRFVIMS
ncbi:hypothetical protein Hypma_009243 [Hypsizygus marmoreus]|uniref:Uncharacterized protein n=1 Tax=Hypsizygus marmoreus TaxID=39966 RepID=A0A369JNX9_HYPMA|nr:hypothetical protein Hypma_009243 [Hypsizygus marmoreus]